MHGQPCLSGVNNTSHTVQPALVVRSLANIQPILHLRPCLRVPVLVSLRFGLLSRHQRESFRDFEAFLDGHEEGSFPVDLGKGRTVRTQLIETRAIQSDAQMHRNTGACNHTQRCQACTLQSHSKITGLHCDYEARPIICGARRELQLACRSWSPSRDSSAGCGTPDMLEDFCRSKVFNQDCAYYRTLLSFACLTNVECGT